MTTLENHVSGEKVTLFIHHVFGRHVTSSHTLLESKNTSRLHASIRWEDSAWKILDHSRNGTWIDEVRMASSKSLSLKIGNLVRFGGKKEPAWKVIDLEPPYPLLLPVEGNAPAIRLERFNALPDDKSHEVSVYFSQTGQWMCENEEGERLLEEGALVHFDRKTWRLANAVSVASTQLEINVEDSPGETPLFTFQISRDEEHVSLKLIHSGGVLDLEERVHHYLLVTLARQKWRDAQEGYDSPDQGWVEFSELSRLLNLNYTYLNSQVFRARKQIAKELPEAILYPPQVIERRSGELRFGFPKFKIFRGSTLEKEMS